MFKLLYFVQNIFVKRGMELFSRRDTLRIPFFKPTRKDAMKQCKDVYILTDKSKFGEVSSVTFGGFTDAKILTEEIPEEYQDSKNILKVK